MQPEQTLHRGVTFRADVLGLKRGLYGMRDRVIGAGHGIGINTMPGEKLGGAQSVACKPPLGKHERPIHSTLTASRSTALRNPEPLSARFAHSFCV